MARKSKTEEKKKVRPIDEAEAAKVAGGPNSNAPHGNAPDANSTPWAPGHAGQGGLGQGE